MRLRHLLCGAMLMAGVGCATAPAEAPVIENISDATARKIGQRVWQNECGGSVVGLTSWNDKENFASLGIGHFIWYPTGTTGPFEESFPAVLKHLAAKGVALPEWLHPDGGCPWPSKAAFDAQRNSVRMKELRNILVNTVPLQATVLAKRFLEGTQKIIAAAPSTERKVIQTRIQHLAAIPAGLYGMMDYVNFKGEGTNPNERWQGTGWGLLQVLQAMKGTPEGPAATQEFASAAQRTLARRIGLAPKPEEQWRAGWMSRCASYAKPF